MAFLSKKLMAKSEKASSKETHPLLKGREVSQGVRLAYLQGCVLATLLDDAQVSAAERCQIEELGRSLGIDDVEIAKSLEVVQGLQSDEDQDAFLKELKAALGEKYVIALFMADFERLMQKPKGMSAEAREGLDFIGGELVGTDNWRRALAACKGKQSKKPTASAPAKTKLKGKDVRAKSIAFRNEALEFIETLKPHDFEFRHGTSYVWTDKDTVRKSRDKVRKHVANLSKVDVDVKEVWKCYLAAIKRKYIEERPEAYDVSGCNPVYNADWQLFDRELFFETIWFLAYLSFVYNIGGNGFDSAIKLSDLEWLFEGVVLEKSFSDDGKDRNESFIWRLLTVANKTIETEEPEGSESFGLPKGCLLCEGWWDE